MFFKKGLGIGLIFTGIYLILTNAFLTGAVVGFGRENIFGILGVLVVIVGVVLVVSTATLERRVKKFGEAEGVDKDPDLIYRAPVGYATRVSQSAYETPNVKIGDNVYDPHAVERMKKRGLVPMIVDSVLKQGEHYELLKRHSFGEAKGATDVYLGRSIGEIVPGHGQGPRRILEVDPQRKRHYDHLLVLTDGEGIVKTVYIANDEKLSQFFKRYVVKNSLKKDSA